MSGINPGILLQAQRIRCHFEDNLNPPVIITGTGFFLRLNPENDVFVTNKHNLDAKLVKGEDTKLSLKSIEIELRIKNLDGTWAAQTEFFKAEFTAYLHPTSDVALIACNFDPRAREQNFSFPNVVNMGDLATQEFFEQSVSVFDQASFIGFAGTANTKWWDTRMNMAIARSVTIASMPQMGFINESIKTSGALLVSGMSFSGSSGSMVILHEKGIRLGAGLSGGNYVPPKIIGIMSGHWWERTPEMFQHSGLSYLTRSTSIFDVIPNVFSAVPAFKNKQS